MKKLLSHQSVTHIGYLRSVLEEAGIACLIKNEQLAGALGEIPFIECWPELWILDDAYRQQAQRLIAAAEAPAEAGEAWQCTNCGETVEGQFVACWQCGTEARSDTPT
jgi:hypothetical protein